MSNPVQSPIDGRSGAKISVVDANNRIHDTNDILLDVRGFGEFAAGHARTATCIPLGDLERRIGELPTDGSVLVMCLSGHRSAMAVQRLRSLGMNNVLDIEGGFLAWSKAGLPTVKQSGAMPLERQVRIVAGTLVFAFSLAGFFIARAYFVGAMLIGFMLAFTGTLGICPMMSLLNLLPWNQVSNSGLFASGGDFEQEKVIP